MQDTPLPPPPPPPPLETLSPRGIPLGGNQVYQCLSLGIFDRHDQHVHIRRRIWNEVSTHAFGCPLDQLVPSALPRPVPDTFPWSGPWKRWLSGVSPAAERVLYSSRDNVRATDLDLVCALAHWVYACTVVVYQCDRRGHERVTTWADTDRERRTVLMRCDQGTVSLLVPSRLDTDLVPTKQQVVIGRHHHHHHHQLVCPRDVPVIQKEHCFSLSMYDSTTRKHYLISPFVPPAAEMDPCCTTVHYLDLDASRVGDLPTNAFKIDGCEKLGQPVYVYAIRLADGRRRHAFLIGHWDRDYASLVISLRPDDDRLAVVPARTPEESARIVAAECKCEVSSRLPSRPSV